MRPACRKEKIPLDNSLLLRYYQNETGKKFSVVPLALLLT